METIKMGNGATYNCSYCVANHETAFVALRDLTWAQVTQIFSDPNNTRRMEYGNLILSGWTDLVAIGKQPYGIQAVLKGGTVTERS